MSDGIKCVGCGRFISREEIDAGRAAFLFEPDSHFGPERSEWTCSNCVDREINYANQ